MQRWNGWSNEVIAVQLEGRARAVDAWLGALLRRSDPDCCMSATRAVTP